MHLDGKHNAPSQARWLSPALLLLFFFSGAAGLVYEIVWTRQLVLIFGTTTFAVSTVLTAFMAGLGAGALLLGRIADRLQRPLALYAILEMGIGLYALAMPLLFDGLVPIYRWLWQTAHLSFYLFSLARFLLTFLILVIPTFLMGATLPVLLRWAVRTSATVGFHTGVLYALNTAGAVVGTLAAAFFLLPALGMQQTTFVAVGVNFTVGLVALFMQHVAPAFAPSVPMKDIVQDEPELLPWHSSRPLLLLAAGISGFVALVYEVAWTRLLTQILGSSTFAFSTMLAAFLCGLALGSAIMAPHANRWQWPLFILTLVQLAIGLSVWAGEFLLQQMPYFYLAGFQLLGLRLDLLPLLQFVLAFLAMSLPTLLLGCAFPLLTQLYATETGRTSRRVGEVYAANTCGTVLGAFATGFLLIPLLGIHNTVTLGRTVNVILSLLLLYFAAAHYALPGPCFRRKEFEQPPRRFPAREAPWLWHIVQGIPKVRPAIFVAGIGVLVLLIFLGPRWDTLLLSTGIYKEAPALLSLYNSPKDAVTRVTRHYRQLYYKEGLTATVSVVERPSLAMVPHLALAVDGKVEASTALDMPTQVLSAHLPLLIHHQPQKVMVIGLASGVTAGSVTQYPVAEITVVEIEPAVIEASHFFDEVNHRPLDDPRVRLIVDDARNYLLATDEKFDIIISEPSNPWMSGPAKLFTHEFFELGRAHLLPGGIFAQWLQLYGLRWENLQMLIRTFHRSFPQVMIFQTSEADLILLGSADSLAINLPQLVQRMSEEKIQQDLQRVEIAEAFDLLVKFRLGLRLGRMNSPLRDGILNTDDNSHIEFAAPKDLYAETIVANLGMLRLAAAEVASHHAETGDPLGHYVVGLADNDLATNGGNEAEHPVISLANFYLKLARRYLRDGNLKEAEAAAKSYLAETTDEAITAATLSVLGEINYQARNPLGAERQWETALKHEPNERHALLRLGTTRLRQEKFAEAEALLSRLARNQPDDSPAVNDDDEINPAVQNTLAHYWHGVSLYHLGRLHEAMNALSACLRSQAPQRMQSPVNCSLFAHFYFALVCERLGQARAADSCRQAFLMDLHNWRQQLENEPEQLIRVNSLHRPNATPVEHLVAESLLSSAEEEAAQKQIAEAVLTPLVHFYEGLVAYYLGLEEYAIAHFETYLNILPERFANPLAHYYLSMAFRGRQQNRLAERHLRKYLAMIGTRDEANASFRKEAMEHLADWSQQQP